VGGGAAPQLRAAGRHAQGHGDRAGRPRGGGVRPRAGSDPEGSPAASYVRAVAALVEDDDEAAARAADGMRGASPAFANAADAIAALARRDAGAYAAALSAIVADFEAREEHLTGVAIADTAVMLERLAAPRGLARRPRSRVLPPRRLRGVRAGAVAWPRASSATTRRPTSTRPARSCARRCEPMGRCSTSSRASSGAGSPSSSASTRHAFSATSRRSRRGPTRVSPREGSGAARYAELSTRRAYAGAGYWRARSDQLERYARRSTTRGGRKPRAGRGGVVAHGSRLGPRAQDGPARRRPRPSAESRCCAQSLVAGRGSRGRRSRAARPRARRGTWARWPLAAWLDAHVGPSRAAPELERPRHARVKPPSPTIARPPRPGRGVRRDDHHRDGLSPRSVLLGQLADRAAARCSSPCSPNTVPTRPIIPGTSR
jgi:hypothetical protein